MMRFNKLIFGTVSALMMVCQVSFAQEKIVDSMSVKVFFRQGSQTIDRSYGGNVDNLWAFARKVNLFLNDSSYRVVSVKLVSGASPEGSSTANAALAKERFKTLRKYLLSNTSIEESLLEEETLGADWSGLADALENIDEPWKDRAIDICRNEPLWIRSNGVIVDGRKKQMMELAGGSAWQWMSTNLFPDLRASEIRLVYEFGYPRREVAIAPVVGVAPAAPVASVVPAASDVKVEKADTVCVTKSLEKVAGDRKFVMALRTNALAIPFMNVGLEIPIGKHWSIGADYYYPWVWRDSEHRNCYEFLAWDIEGRYWFSKAPKALPEAKLTGHSIGLYCAMGYYDFEKDWSGHQGDFFNVGIDYLYSVPIFKGCMHLEFEIGIGFIHSKADIYDCFVDGGNCYRRKGQQKDVNWFGPTRAQISLVVPIYCRKKVNTNGKTNGDEK